MKKIKKISELEISERPREKLKHKGVGALSDQELLAVLLGSGIKGRNVFALAKSVLAVVDVKNGGLALDDLASVSGMGFAKAAQVLAALEFSRRRIRPEHQRISSALDVLPLVRHYADRKQEHFFCISLNYQS